MQVFLVSLFAVLIGRGAKWLAGRGPRIGFFISCAMLSLGLWAMLFGPVAVIYGITHNIDPERALVAAAPICILIAATVLLGIRVARRLRSPVERLSYERQRPKAQPRLVSWRSREPVQK